MLASAVIAYPQRVLLMVPTTVLAKQIYKEAKKYLPNHIKSILITNSTPKESKTDIDRYSFIIGTHALLYSKLHQ